MKLLNKPSPTDQLKIVGIVVFFVALVAINLFAPFLSDDFFHQLLLSNDTLLQRQSDGSLFGLYSFFDQSPASRVQMQELGVLPWFAEADFYFRFWRPLTELSLKLDQLMSAKNPVVAHGQSIAWMLACAWLVWLIAERLFANQKQIALLALAIFLWDGQHVASIHWIANRHALIGGFFLLAALYSFLRQRQAGNALWLLALWAFYLASLLASETAVVLLVYVFFYLLLLESSSYRQKLLLLLPLLLITLIWQFYYRQLGFGADTGQGLYLDPLSDFPQFLLAVLQRFPIYVTSLLLPVPAGAAWVFGMQWSVLFSLAAWLFLLILAYKAWPWLRGERLVLFCFLSGFVSILPVCSSLPQDRLVFLATIGVDIGLAVLIIRLWQHADYQYLAKWLVVIHLVLSPLHLLAGSWYMTSVANTLQSNALSLDDAMADKTLVVLQMPIGEAVALMGTRHFHGKPIAEQFYWLASDEQAMQVKVWDEYSFVAEKATGFGSGFESAFGRHQRQPFYLDQTIKLNQMTVLVESLTEAGLPERIRVIFDVPLNSEQLQLMTWHDGRLSSVLLHEQTAL